MNSIAFFDFDGTITSRDSFYSFLRFSVSPFRFYYNFLLLSPFYLLHYLRLLTAFKLKMMVFSLFYKGMRSGEWQDLCEKFSKNIIPRIIRPEAEEKWKWHQQQGHKIVVVSANFDQIIKPWCQQQGFELIASTVCLEGDKVSGKITGAECHGAEKVNRINLQFKLSEYHPIYAYGDSKGDLPMLRLAQKKFRYYRCF